ncbi:MAG: response regulator [Chloroflexota bacterium]
MRDSSVDGAKKVVLVLEDDKPIGELIRSVLAEEGLEPLLASNGIQALAFVREHLPELLLADIHLAGSEPVEDIVHAVRSFTGPELPLLAMSASREDGRAEALEAYGFLSKPFDLATLLEEVQRGLELRQQRVRLS